MVVGAAHLGPDLAKLVGLFVFLLRDHRPVLLVVLNLVVLGRRRLIVVVVGKDRRGRGLVGHHAHPAAGSALSAYTDTFQAVPSRADQHGGRDAGSRRTAFHCTARSLCDVSLVLT